MTADEFLCMARLARYLGPWAAGRPVTDVVRDEVRLQVAADNQSDSMRVYEYRKAQHRELGVYLVLPGLHFLGPDDPRLDRFCRSLAASGFRVVAPFLRSFCRLLLDPSLLHDAACAHAYARQRARALGLPPPRVFSISFGSLPALSLAASDEPPQATLLFGGFADFQRTVRFATAGTTTHLGQRLLLRRDPLNAPVVFLNVLAELELRGDRELLDQAWRRMVSETWGRMELKQPGARDPIAKRIAQGLPGELQKPFLRGCMLEPDALDWLGAALEAATERFRFLDPSPLLTHVRSPVTLVHGLDDDVIPFTESIALRERIPHAKLLLTGLFSHTQSERVGPVALLKEARTMAAMLRAIAVVPT